MRMGADVADTVAFMKRTEMAKTLMAGVTDDAAAAAWKAVADALLPFATSDSVVLHGKAWLVTATKRA